MQDPEDELEEGEVAEEGELPMPSAQAAKRHRMHGPPKAQQPYRFDILLDSTPVTGEVPRL